MMDFLRSLVPLDSPIRVMYHAILGFFAFHLSGNPAKEMIVIGVTGTKGKTTTTNIIARGLTAAGHRVAMFSTVNMMIGDEVRENNLKMTSPSPFVLWNFLSEARSKGATYAVIETSSHALFYQRVYGLRYDVAVLTNISQDHLDLHKTMENYVATKLLLFKNLYRHGIRKGVRKVGVVNIDSPFASSFLSKDIVVDNMYTFGFTPAAQVRADDIRYAPTGMKFTVKMPSNQFELETKLQGEFNISNILAATSVLMSQKVNIETIAGVVRDIGGIPGRLEEVPNLRKARIYVDYAHTEESLRSVLETIRKIDGVRRIITVFGATGDRDTTKRPKMGRVVDSLSEVVILTDDDTYTESSLKIIREVTEGISRREGEDFWIVPSREDALRTALLMLQEGDALLVAGKGAETVLVTNQGPVAWNDRKMIEKILMEIEAQVMV